MKQHHALLLALICTFSSGVSAQWQWVDKDGRKVFSDRAPPIEIPDRNILKQPGGLRKATPAPAGASPEGSEEKGAETAHSKPAPAPTAAAPALSGADKELQARKAQAEAAEAAKKKAEDDLQAKRQADNCTRARSAKISFESGQLLRHTNAQGENVFMDEATRTAELQRIQKMIESDCKR